MIIVVRSSTKPVDRMLIATNQAPRHVKVPNEHMRSTSKELPRLPPDTSSRIVRHLPTTPDISRRRPSPHAPTNPPTLTQTSTTIFNMSLISGFRCCVSRSVSSRSSNSCCTSVACLRAVLGPTIMMHLKLLLF